MIDLTPILEAVLSLAAAAITAFVIPFLKRKLTQDQQREINSWVKIAVGAAEQIFVGPGRGDEKKAYVLTWLERQGYTVDEEKLDAMIEAAVHELTNNGIIVEESTISEEG